MRVLVVIGLAVTGEAVVRHRTRARRRRSPSSRTARAPAPDCGPSAPGRGRVPAPRSSTRPGADHAAALGAAADLVVPSPGVPERHPAVAARAPSRRAVALRDRPRGRARRRRRARARRGHRHERQDHGHDADRGDARRRRRPRGRGRQHRAPARSTRCTTTSTWSSPRCRRSSSRSPTPRSAPRAAALLNLGADHLDWHRTFDAYAHAKAQRLRATSVPTTCSCSTPTTRSSPGSPRPRPARRVPFSVVAGAAATGCRLVDTASGSLLVTPSTARRSSPLDDARRAAAPARPRQRARRRGARARRRCATLGRRAARSTTFTGSPHRMQLVAEHDGVRYVDDSKATNVHATHRRRPRPRPRRAHRGRSEQGPRPRSSCARSRPSLRAVVAIGDAAPEVDEAFAGVGARGRGRTSMRDAVRGGVASCAEAGDTVLLSARVCVVRLVRVVRRARRRLRARGPTGSWRCDAMSTAAAPSADARPPTAPRHLARASRRTTCCSRDVGVLNVIGVVMVLSASSVVSLTSYGSAWYFFQRQLVVDLARRRSRFAVVTAHRLPPLAVGSSSRCSS